MRASPGWQNGRFRFARDFNRWMEKFGERFDARDKPRARPRKITVGFERVDAPVANGGHGIPLLGKIDRKVFVASPLRALPTRRDQKNLRLSLHHILQMNTEKRRPHFSPDPLPPPPPNPFPNPTPPPPKPV